MDVNRYQNIFFICGLSQFVLMLRINLDVLVITLISISSLLTYELFYPADRSTP